MKRIMLTTLLFLSTHAVASDLTDYNHIRSAVLMGNNIRVAVDITKCTAEKGAPSSYVHFGVFTATKTIIDDQSQVVTSFTKFTNQHPMFPNKPVYEYLHYSFAKDNNLTLNAQILDASNYQSLTPIFVYTCKLGDAVQVYA